jgi:hypothetical protein
LNELLADRVSDGAFVAASSAAIPQEGSRIKVPASNDSNRDIQISPFARAPIAQTPVSRRGGFEAGASHPAAPAVGNRCSPASLSVRNEETRMPISNSPLVERIARVLAGREFSSNADGSDPSASAEVEAAWRDHVEDALSILRTMREPDTAMAAAGDEEIWERMVGAALEEAVETATS